MTDRIITTFGRNNKKLLRDYFNNIYGLDVKNIKQINNVLGAEDNNESWEYLRKKYIIRHDSIRILIINVYQSWI